MRRRGTGAEALADLDLDLCHADFLLIGVVREAGMGVSHEAQDGVHVLDEAVARQST
ncbi:MAG: hypothetical protein OXE84_11715 [Rhodobacteraceae bacterium]|nr:hypothetical protein [Paracoccaceae bacterium]MCY4197514.1 hypothetical protein [Paracoccaceae bacterium]